MENKVTAIVNQKGGIGKTTTVLNLGYALSEQGKKVLLIDFDPQASLTSALGVKGDNITNIQTLMTSSIEEDDIEEDYAINIKKNLYLIPSALDLAGIEMTLVNVMSRETILKYITDEIKKDYDYVLIDCSPSLGTLTINALAACDSVIIPVTPEFLSAKGLGLLVKNINLIKKRINPSIKIDGILITMLNKRTNLSKQMINAIGDSTGHIMDQYNLNIKVFKSMIPVSVKAGEAILHKKSVIEYEPKNQVSGAYKNFAKEWGDIDEQKTDHN
jgi:chromosome partitioning protein